MAEAALSASYAEKALGDIRFSRKNKRLNWISHKYASLMISEARIYEREKGILRAQ